MGGQCPSETGTKLHPVDSPPAHAGVEEITAYDPRELDGQLWDIARALQVGAAAEQGREKTGRLGVVRSDPAHEAMSSRHAQPMMVSRKRKSKTRHYSIGGSFLAVLVWAALSLGIAALTCGGMLLGWSLWTGRGELWKIGLPIAAAGQVSLLIGLLLQINRFWLDNHRTAARLDRVGEALRDLKTNAARLKTIHGPSPAPSYMHLDSGVNSQLLLGDLRGQLDSLESKIQEKE